MRYCLNTAIKPCHATTIQNSLPTPPHRPTRNAPAHSSPNGFPPPVSVFRAHQQHGSQSNYSHLSSVATNGITATRPISTVSLTLPILSHVSMKPFALWLALARG